MLIRQGDPLSSRKRYVLYRTWIVFWILLFVLYFVFWSRIGIALKIVIFCALALTLPDSLQDLWRSYESYKEEWNRVNGPEKGGKS